jgi:hypothetical protein
MVAREGFVAHTASSHADEADANLSWNKPNPPYIPSQTYTYALLDVKVQALLATTWKAVSPRDGAGRARVAIGGQRGAAVGDTRSPSQIRAVANLPRPGPRRFDGHEQTLERRPVHRRQRTCALGWHDDTEDLADLQHRAPQPDLDALGSTHLDAFGSSHLDAFGSSHLDAFGSSLRALRRLLDLSPLASEIMSFRELACLGIVLQSVEGGGGFAHGGVVSGGVRGLFASLGEQQLCPA